MNLPKEEYVFSIHTNIFILPLFAFCFQLFAQQNLRAHILVPFVQKGAVKAGDNVYHINQLSRVFEPNKPSTPGEPVEPCDRGTKDHTFQLLSNKNFCEEENLLSHLVARLTGTSASDSLSESESEPLDEPLDE